MKTLRLIALIVLLNCANHSAAQSLRGGLFTGFNIAYLETESMQTKAQKFSFSVPAGLIINKTLNRSYGLQAEINYVRMGERIDGMQSLTNEQLAIGGLPEGTSAFASFRNDIRLHYLQVPLLVRAAIRVHPLVTYYALFGPAVSFLIDGNSVVNGSSLLYNDIEGKTLYTLPEYVSPQGITLHGRIPLRNEYRSVNLSGIGAAGLQVNTGSGSFFLEARMTAGFTNIYKDPLKQGTNYTNALACMLGYTFSF